MERMHKRFFKEKITASYDLFLLSTVQMKVQQPVKAEVKWKKYRSVTF